MHSCMRACVRARACARARAEIATHSSVHTSHCKFLTGTRRHVGEDARMRAHVRTPGWLFSTLRPTCHIDAHIGPLCLRIAYRHSGMRSRAKSWRRPMFAFLPRLYMPRASVLRSSPGSVRHDHGARCDLRAHQARRVGQDGQRSRYEHSGRGSRV